VFDKLLLYFSSGYWFLAGPFIVLLLCGLGLPIPEDIILVVAGLLTAQKESSFVLILMLMYLGVLLGDSFMFLLGKYGGEKLYRFAIFRRILSEDRQKLIKNYFDKYGSFVIFVARFLPGLRSPLFFSSGMMGFSFFKFLFWDFVAASFSVYFWVWLGYWAWNTYGGEYEELKKTMSFTQQIVLCVVLVVVVFFVIYVKKKGLFKKNEKNNS